MGSRIVIALAILIADLVTVAVPLGAFFLAYVLLARPKWVKQFVEELYQDEKKGESHA
jgi:hypothetical protein